MPHNLARGKRENHSLELVEFDLVKLVGDGGNPEIMGWENNEVGTANWEALEKSLRSFYEKEREEHIGDILGLEQDVIIHIYDENGVFMVEDYNQQKGTVEIERENQQAFLDQILTVEDNPAWSDVEFERSTYD